MAGVIEPLLSVSPLCRATPLPCPSGCDTTGWCYDRQEDDDAAGCHAFLMGQGTHAHRVRAFWTAFQLVGGFDLWLGLFQRAATAAETCGGPDGAAEAAAVRAALCPEAVASTQAAVTALLRFLANMLRKDAHLQVCKWDLTGIGPGGRFR